MTTPSTNPLIEHLRHRLPAELKEALSASSQKSAATLTKWIQEASATEVEACLETLFESPSEVWTADPTVASSILVGAIRRQDVGQLNFSPAVIGELGSKYAELSEYPAVQALLLRLCVASSNQAMRELFADLIVHHGQLGSRQYVEIFGDLLRLAADAVPIVFPKLLDGLDQSRLASFVLDYANFAFRNRMADPHPAADHASRLKSLLSSLADRLRQLQDSPPESEAETLGLGRQVTEGVALGIALCDALALIGDAEAIASLNKALHVEHRRLRVEAAAALAKLGVEDAKKILTAMAAEPSERLRVLAYAEELDLLDEVDEEFSNVVARAEAEFVAHLMQPMQMGIAPQHIELIDQREQYWPGFEEPRTCFLFQFIYQFPNGEFTNIGIAGPVVMTFEADLTHLEHSDVYAVFAGWHVDHPEIFAVEPNRVVGQDQIHVERMLRCLTDNDDFSEVVPALLGNLLDRRVLIAQARRNEQPGWAMVSEDSVRWIDSGNPNRPLGAGDAFHLFVGRSLLRSFN